MDKRKLRSDSAREGVQSARVLRTRPTKTDTPSPKRQKQSVFKRKGRKNPITQGSTPILHRFLSEEPTRILPLNPHAPSPPPPPPSPPPPLTSLSTQITISNILTIISKSLSGLRLRQNSILLNRIPPEFHSYASAISRSPLLADKLLAFRTSGPSFNAIIHALIPLPGTSRAIGTTDTLETNMTNMTNNVNETNGILMFNELFLTRWIVMRLFAFGHPDLISSLATIEAPKDVLKARATYSKSSGKGVNSIPAYGNVRFDPKRVPGYVNRVFEGGQKLFAAMVGARQKEGGMIRFHEALELIGKASIPYYSSGSLLQWLLACDLAELDGVVVPPTARDLAVRIGCCANEKKGGSGAWNGLVKGTKYGDWPKLTVGILTDHLEGIYHGVKEGLGTQEVLFRDRGFWYSDLEHCLCKVIRAEKY